MKSRRPQARTFRPIALAATAFLFILPGCTQEAASTDSYVDLGFTGSDSTGLIPAAWPDLNGTLRILDHGAFAAFDTAAAQFKVLTGMNVEHSDAGDAGSSINQAILQRADPDFDVIYGIDNIYFGRAVAAEVLEPYTPVFASRVPAAFRFFTAEPWPATPVDHGYVGINTDTRHPAMQNRTVPDLFAVRDNAHLFVTQDPRTSSPGAAFLLATIATFGEGQTSLGYDWLAYWNDLFDGGVLVTSDWSTAYEQHFSGGYGPSYGGLGDKPIVTSYTESPAYEAYFGRPVADLADVTLAPKSTFHQIQTMAILKGTDHRAAAEAWIEFTLTDFFQELAAPENAVYPIVPSINVTAVYGGLDPLPGTFQPADMDTATIGSNLQRWLEEWTALCEAHDCA